MADGGVVIPVGRLTVATPETMALAIRSDTVATTAVDERVGPVAADVLVNNPQIQQAVADKIAGLSGIVVAAPVTDEYEIAVADSNGNPSWLRAKSNGDPSEFTKKTIRRAVGVHSGPLPSDYAQSGEQYTWFVTDPVTGELLDIRNGVG